MKEIKLTQGKVAFVDDEDFEELNKHSWYAAKNYDRGGYAQRVDNNRKTLRMHRVIMKAKKGEMIDHIKGNGLNNQKENLRFCNSQQNCTNRISNKNANSKYLGVSYHKRDNKFQARITRDRKCKYLGIFTLEIDAAKAYNEAAKKYHGEFARLNIIT